MQAAHASRRAPTRNNTAGFFAPYTTGKCAGVSNEGATPITHFHSIHRPAAAIASKSKKASRAAASIRIRGTDAKPILKAIVAQVVPKNADATSTKAISASTPCTENAPKMANNTCAEAQLPI